MRKEKQPQGYCATIRPTKKQFERPFRLFVRELFRKHPDWACFKVVPPKGWAPRKTKYKWKNIEIATPIKQHVFGQNGAFMALLEEQKGMSAADFKQLACNAEHRTPAKGHGEDNLLERAFWKQITMDPPLYGADTPVSLFDNKLPWGWNLRHLNCLLSDYNVPAIPGVNSPMAYFGMWKSFFGWHKEDVDLYSVNYNHCGAAKVWYCVSPAHAKRFDAMAKALFPAHAVACPAFMRHKDIMISPSTLRAHNVPFVQAKQEPGEFIVLNAAAYHAGFNLGFNCAEAVNFALPEWLEVGKHCVNCTCDALPDSVQLDMGIFFPELNESSSDEEGDSDSEAESVEGEEEEERPAPRQTNDNRRQPTAAAVTAPRRKAATQSAKRKSSPRAAVDAEGKAPAAKRRRRDAPPRVPEALPSARAPTAPRTALHPAWGRAAEDRPLALVFRHPHTRQLGFSLAHRLDRAAKPGALWVGVLEEGADGLFRPTAEVRQAELGVRYPKLVHVRSEWVAGPGRSRGGWKLTTLRKRILM